MATKSTSAAAKKTTARKTSTTTRKPRTTNPKVEEPKVEKIQIPSVQFWDGDTTNIVSSLPTDPAQRSVIVNSYWDFKNAGLPVPDAIRIPVENAIAEQQANLTAEQERAIEIQQLQAKAASDRAADLNINGPTYVRNCTNNPFNLRLDRQSEGNGRQRRIELKPRGVPGDIHPLKDEDLQDPGLVTEIRRGLLELIAAGEADDIARKQTTNMTTRVHPAMQILNKEADILSKNGVPTAQHPNVRIEAEYNSQGVTVATLNPDVMSGKLDDRAINRSGDLGGGMTRGDAPIQSTFIPTGGNPASISLDPMASLKIQDDLARRKGLQGPAAGLGGQVSVKVEPVQRYNG